MRILIVSNGFAEDLVGAGLARRLQGQRQDGDLRLQVMALPLLGMGESYRAQGIDLPLGAGLRLPSAGFGRLSLPALWRDLRAGLWSETRRWVGRLAAALATAAGAPANAGAGPAALVCVGDTYLLFLAWWAWRRAGPVGRSVPVYFLPTAKSEWLRGHARTEYWLMRTFARQVFPRDRVTEAAFRRRGVRATYLGNPLLDVGGAAEGWRRRQERPPSDLVTEEGFTVGLLPGSRQDSRENLEKLLAVARAIMSLRPDGGWRFTVAAAPGRAGRIAVQTPNRDTAGTHAGAAADDVDDGPPIEIVDFPELLGRAEMVIGLAGTAHEQAVALGIPVIAFPGGRLQYTDRFARAQQRLLGAALELCPDFPEAVARAAIALRDDPDRRARMGAAGRERMGDPGARALDAIARAIADDLARS